MGCGVSGWQAATGCGGVPSGPAEPPAVPRRLAAPYRPVARAARGEPRTRLSPVNPTPREVGVTAVSAPGGDVGPGKAGRPSRGGCEPRMARLPLPPGPRGPWKAAGGSLQRSRRPRTFQGQLLGGTSSSLRESWYFLRAADLPGLGEPGQHHLPSKKGPSRGGRGRMGGWRGPKSAPESEGSGRIRLSSR